MSHYLTIFIIELDRYRSVGRFFEMLTTFSSQSHITGQINPDSVLNIRTTVAFKIYEHAQKKASPFFILALQIAC